MKAWQIVDSRTRTRRSSTMASLHPRNLHVVSHVRPPSFPLRRSSSIFMAGIDRCISVQWREVKHACSGTIGEEGSYQRRPARPKDGCLTCKRRKVRCNEQKPRFSHCERLNLECSWTLNRQKAHPRATPQTICTTGLHAAARPRRHRPSCFRGLRLCQSPREVSYHMFQQAFAIV